MEEITVGQLQALQKPLLEEGLCEERPPSVGTLFALRGMFPGLDKGAFAISRVAPLAGCKSTVGDVVHLLHDGARSTGDLLLHLKAQGESWSVVSVWKPAPRAEGANASSSRLEMVEGPQLFPTASSEVSLIHSRHASGKAVVLDPPGYRRK